jgi:general secretion pathway protein N
MAGGLTARHGGSALLLGALCAGLVFVIYGELVEPAEGPGTLRSSAANAEGPQRPASTSDASNLPPIDAYAEVVKRPLFSTTRQPPPPAAAQDSTGKSSFVLIGIVISQSERTALIQAGRGATIARLREGQTVDGWTVQSIAADRVTLERGGVRQELKLKNQPTTGRPNPPAPPPRG